MFQKAVHEENSGADDENVMDAMLTMVHSIVSSAEVFMKHGSISKQGGFVIKINGIKIFKVILTS
jgi:hypothetical protein